MNGDKSWLELEGRVCVVSGAASGIGASLAQRLAGVGARVVLLDRDATALERKNSELQAQASQTLALPCDISDVASVQAAADTVRARWGQAYALFNNAGLLRPGGLADVSLGNWNQVLAVNLTRYLLCARAFGEAFRRMGVGVGAQPEDAPVVGDRRRGQLALELERPARGVGAAAV